jgi:hypothetical protein
MPFRRNGGSFPFMPDVVKQYIIQWCGTKTESWCMVRQEKALGQGKVWEIRSVKLNLTTCILFHVIFVF